MFIMYLVLAKSSTKPYPASTHRLSRDRTTMYQSDLKETSPSADLVKDLYKPLPVTPSFEKEDHIIELLVEDSFEAFKKHVESAQNEGPKANLRDLFHESHAYWRDTLALTWHLRTFEGSTRAGNALDAASRERGMRDMVVVKDSIRVVRPQPELSWIEFLFDFKTSSPKADCRGKMMLLYTPGEHGLWSTKIWIMSTWLVDLADFPQMEERLRIPPEPQSDDRYLTTDVLIVGAGNWGLTLASRLKTLGVNCILVDKNEHIGDNWAKRYDNMKFHVPKSFAETPYIQYPGECPDRLTRDDLAAQMRRFAKELQLEDSVLTGTTITRTTYDSDGKVWSVELNTGKHVTSRHVVLATGILSSAPYEPLMVDPGRYEGIEFHSVDFRNSESLEGYGVKTVTIVGSANTAFDVAQDCHDRGYQVTMIQRSPTLIVPWEYYVPEGLGMYNHLPVEVADANIFGGPFAVGCQMLAGVHARLAAAEPDRFAELKKTGFQVMDCTQGDLMANLLGRHGGHYVDIGGSALAASSNFRVLSSVEPMYYTRKGILVVPKGEDGPKEEVVSDAIIWCTGFSDLDMRNVAAEILGKGGDEVRDAMETTWGLSMEGEHRGMFVRQKGLKNFWVVGGGCAHQRWYSRVVAWQIKAELEHILPDPYLD